MVPAHAGVILDTSSLTATATCGSRTRGGDPLIEDEAEREKTWFPHTRG